MARGVNGIVQTDVWSEFKEQVRARTDLVSLIGETRTVTAKRGGREYVTLCPFHDDHDPSLTINPERQTYRCWVCDAGGDCFSYLQKLEGLDFRSALEQLADRAGLEMPRAGRGQNSRRGSDRNTVYDALNWAAETFHQCLLRDPAAEVARDYLLDRGFDEEIWMDFQLGFQPGGWDWLMKSAPHNFSRQILEDARLIKRRNSGEGYHDFFRNRIMFPIRNERNQTIAFGGRALPGSEDEKYGKYQNSAESVYFSKSKQLYGMEHAKQAMRDREEVIVVEGYTDCISLHQVGIANVVATLGTALTHEHVSLIRRFCRNVILIFDGDAAGQNAADRALPRLLAHEIELKLLSLPEGTDPPEYLERHGMQEFQNLLQNAQEGWEFKLQRLVEEHGLNSDFGREQIARQMLELLAVAPGLPGTKREDLLLNRLANRVGLRGQQEQKLRRDLEKYRQSGPQVATQSRHASASGQSVDFFHHSTNDQSSHRRQEVDQLLKPDRNPLLVLERELLEIVFTLPECIAEIVDRDLLPIIRTTVVRDLLVECDRQHRQGAYTGPDSLLTATEDLELKRFILALADAAEEKQIDKKLSEMTQDSRGNRCPKYLSALIDQLFWKTKESEHRASASQIIIEPAETMAVDERMRQLLQDAANHHQQRVTRKPASTE